MARFNFRIVDPAKRVLAENFFDEVDMASARRAAITAAAIFSLSFGINPGGTIEISDAEGRVEVVRMEDDNQADE